VVWLVTPLELSANRSGCEIAKKIVHRLRAAKWMVGITYTNVH